MNLFVDNNEYQRLQRPAQAVFLLNKTREQLLGHRFTIFAGFINIPSSTPFFDLYPKIFTEIRIDTVPIPHPTASTPRYIPVSLIKSTGVVSINTQDRDKLARYLGQNDFQKFCAKFHNDLFKLDKFHCEGVVVYF